MTSLVFYIFVTAVAMGLTIWLIVSGRRSGPPQQEEGARAAYDTPDAAFFQLADRIFDPRDYLWLRDQLSFPEGAEALARARRDLAIKWLEALQHSFDELVATPELSRETGRALDTNSSGWQLLGLTLRFQFLIKYALLVVRIFGPYHRLLPSFGWMRAFPLFAARERSGATVRPLP